MSTRTWTVADSAALYRVSGWGDPSICIDACAVNRHTP